MEAPRILVVAERGAKLHVHRGAIVVETRDGRYTVPVSDVDRVVLATSQISITTAAIRRLARLGIDIVVLDARGTPVVTLSPPWINASSAVRVSQYRAASSNEQRLAIARGIVAAKVESQAAMLECLDAIGVNDAGREAERVRMLAGEALRAESVERLRVVEAAAARHYWRVLASTVLGELGFHGRDPDAGDDVNTMLNYLYALLYSLVHRYLVLYGLDPYVGFMHRDRSGAESLVYDVSEVFRVVAVDALVYHLASTGFRPERDPDTGLLSPEARIELVKRFREWSSRRVLDASTGRRDTIEGHVARQARLLASAVRRGSAPAFYTMPGGGACPW